MNKSSQYVVALLLGTMTLKTQAIKQPLGVYENDRDATNGYPDLGNASKEEKKFVNQYIKPETGMFRT